MQDKLMRTQAASTYWGTRACARTPHTKEGTLDPTKAIRCNKKHALCASGAPVAATSIPPPPHTHTKQNACTQKSAAHLQHLQPVAHAQCGRLTAGQCSGTLGCEEPGRQQLAHVWWWGARLQRLPSRCEQQGREGGERLRQLLVGGKVVGYGAGSTGGTWWLQYGRYMDGGGTCRRVRDASGGTNVDAARSNSSR